MLRRPFWQRVVARSERDAAVRERDATHRELNTTLVRLAALEARTIALEEAAQARRADDQLRRLADALSPTPDCRAAIEGWNIPQNASIAAPPQRYGDNRNKYVQRGGEFCFSDISGFVLENPYMSFDRARFYFLSLAFDLVKKQQILGDILELGVDKGNSASVLSLWAKRLDRVLYLLDTFEGFAPADLVGVDEGHAVSFADADVNIVLRRLAGNHIRVIKGYFPDTASQIPEDATFCLIHLDCDLYQPFIAALEFFWPRLNPGGFLVMHDYMSLYWDGVEKAVDEFFASRAECIVPMPDMGGTVVVRKNAAR